MYFTHFLLLAFISALFHCVLAVNYTVTHSAGSPSATGVEVFGLSPPTNSVCLSSSRFPSVACSALSGRAEFHGSYARVQIGQLTKDNMEAQCDDCKGISHVAGLAYSRAAVKEDFSLDISLGSCPMLSLTSEITFADDRQNHIEAQFAEFYAEFPPNTRFFGLGREFLPPPAPAAENDLLDAELSLYPEISSPAMLHTIPHRQLVNGTDAVLGVSPPGDCPPYLLYFGTAVPTGLRFDLRQGPEGPVSLRVRQAGGTLDLVVAGTNYQQYSVGTPLHSALVALRKYWGMPLLLTLPPWVRGVQYGGFFNVPGDAAISDVTSAIADIAESLPLSGGGVIYHTMNIGTWPEGAYNNHAMDKVRRWLREQGAALVGVSQPLVPQTSRETYDRAQAAIKPTWNAAAAAGALVPAHPLQAHSVAAADGVAYGVFTKGTRWERMGSSAYDSVGALSLHTTDAQVWWADLLQHGHENCMPVGADFGYDAYLVTDVDPVIDCTGPVCSDGDAAGPGLHLHYDPTHFGVESHSLPYDTAFQHAPADDLLRQQGPALPARRRAHVAGTVVAHHDALKAQSVAAPLVISDSVFSGVHETVLAPSTYTDVIDHLASLPARLAYTGARVAGVSVFQSDVFGKIGDITCLNLVIQATMMHPLFTVHLAGLQGRSTYPNALKRYVQGALVTRRTFGRHLAPAATSAPCIYCGLELVFPDPEYVDALVTTSTSTGTGTGANMALIDGRLLVAPVTSVAEFKAGHRQVHLPAGARWFVGGGRTHVTGEAGAVTDAWLHRLRRESVDLYVLPPFFVKAGTSLLTPSLSPVLPGPSGGANDTLWVYLDSTPTSHVLTFAATFKTEVMWYMSAAGRWVFDIKVDQTGQTLTLLDSVVITIPAEILPAGFYAYLGLGVSFNGDPSAPISVVVEHIDDQSFDADDLRIKLVGAVPFRSLGVSLALTSSPETPHEPAPPAPPAVTPVIKNHSSTVMIIYLVFLALVGVGVGSWAAVSLKKSWKNRSW